MYVLSEDKNDDKFYNMIVIPHVQVLSLHLVTVERPIEEVAEKMESTLLTLDVEGHSVSSVI